MPEISGSSHSSKYTRGRRGSAFARCSPFGLHPRGAPSSSAVRASQPIMPPNVRIMRKISATLRWLKRCTSSPTRASCAAMSACRSEKPRTRSGCSARMRSIFALVNAETRGFSLRARAGRTVKPEIPTMRRSSPSRYSVSVVSSVRQTIRCGKEWAVGMPRRIQAQGRAAPPGGLKQSTSACQPLNLAGDVGATLDLS